MQRLPSKTYLKNLGALYGNAEAVQRKPRAKRQHHEETEQILFIVWFERFAREKNLRCFHVPNGGYRSPQEAAKFKRLGVRAGIPDILCPVARKGRHGLAIEFKRRDGKMSDLSESQKDWLNYLDLQGWCAKVAFGFEDAKKIVLEYFS